MITPVLPQNPQDALSALPQLFETEPVVALLRLAGIGETTPIPQFADAVPNSKVAAMTHKAAATSSPRPAHARGATGVRTTTSTGPRGSKIVMGRKIEIKVDFTMGFLCLSARRRREEFGYDEPLSRDPVWRHMVREFFKVTDEEAVAAGLLPKVPFMKPSRRTRRNAKSINSALTRDE